MSNINNLRTALSGKESAAEAGRAAGEGIWTYYARAMLHFDSVPDTTDSFDHKHVALVGKLEAIRPLTKNERNSLISAKCVLRKAFENKVQVWRTDDAGSVIMTADADGVQCPTPRGKNDLQDAKSDFDKIMACIENAKKKFCADTREPFTKEQYEELSRVILALAFDVGNQARAVVE